ncbi:MAG: aminopeptidase P family protein [Gammaproteobacteria bacterium]|nr:aminopeptidase P family protein [Gammaproteobacteria bacterium]
MKTITLRLGALRTTMREANIAAYIVPTTDEYLGEYVPEQNQRLAYLSGFTGSAGTLVVTQERAALFVDGRYTLQASNQCPTPLFEHHHLINEPVLAWLKETLQSGQTVALDGRVVTYRFFKTVETELGELNISLQALTHNPIDDIWTDRPTAVISPAILLSEAFSGESSTSKRARIANNLKAAGADAAIISQLDSIAWLLNIRGNDVPHLPVLLSQSILLNDGTQHLFIDSAKIPHGFDEHVGKQVFVHEAEDFSGFLERYGAQQPKVLLDPDGTNALTALTCLSSNCHLIEGKDPVELPKAQKNTVEVSGIREAHIRDGAALSEYLCWIDGEVAKGHYHDEGVLSDRLEQFRRALPELKDLSFSTISAAGSNAAMAHYSHTNGIPAALTPNSLYLVDSGGQYFDGTTDVTRTIAIDEPRADHKNLFTRVLKGHIALAMASFPEGVQGHQLDVLARQFLWEIGKDFDHGTGHGVGCYLSVHEGPQRIGKSPHPTASLLPGMVVSNEPGYYEPNDYGIRCENLMVVVRLASGMLGFETLTFAPFDHHLIDKSILTEAERRWLNDYHEAVFEKLGDRIDPAAKPWLLQATAAL